MLLVRSNAITVLLKINLKKWKMEQDLRSKSNILNMQYHNYVNSLILLLRTRSREFCTLDNECIKYLRHIIINDS